MLVAMSVGATEEEIEDVKAHIAAEGLTAHESRGMERVGQTHGDGADVRLPGWTDRHAHPRSFG